MNELALTLFSLLLSNAVVAIDDDDERNEVFLVSRFLAIMLGLDALDDTTLSLLLDMGLLVSAVEVSTVAAANAASIFFTMSLF